MAKVSPIPILGGNKYFKSSQSSMYVCKYVYMYNVLDNTTNICILLVKFSSLYFEPNFRS
jgi:hypothetical protein